MYSIGNFVFGVNLKDAPKKWADEIEALEEFGFGDSLYSGNSEAPVFVGQRLTSIDEANDLDWSEIVSIKDKLKAAMAEDSTERKAFEKAASAIKAEVDLSDEFKEWFSKQKPEVFLTWSTS